MKERRMRYQWNIKQLCIYVALASGILFFGYRILFVSSSGLLEQISAVISYPVLVAQRKVIQPISRLFVYSKTEAALQNQLYDLYKEQEKLIAENIALRASLAYAQDIQEVQQFKKKYAEHNPVIALVLVRHTSDQEHYFLVNAGSQHTIKKDMVAVYNNCLLGRVTDVYPWYSKVQLITDKACSIAAYCPKTKAKGIHQGLNTQEHTQLNFVSHLDNVALDDVIISSGKGLVFPQGFGLGRVVNATKNGLHHHVMIKPLIDFNNLDYVLLISKN